MRDVAMTSDVCAMKLRNGMGGNPHGFCQGVREPLGLSKTGRSVLVSSMPLKGTGELRQTNNRPGLAKRSHGEFKRSGCQPTGKVAPVSKLCPMGQSVVGDV